MKQLTIFDEPKRTRKTFQLHSRNRIEFLVIPIQDGLKLIKIYPGKEMVLRLSQVEYERFKTEEDLTEVFQ